MQKKVKKFACARKCPPLFQREGHVNAQFDKLTANGDKLTANGDKLTANGVFHSPRTISKSQILPHIQNNRSP